MNGNEAIRYKRELNKEIEKGSIYWGVTFMMIILLMLLCTYHLITSPGIQDDFNYCLICFILGLCVCFLRYMASKNCLGFSLAPYLLIC